MPDDDSSADQQHRHDLPVAKAVVAGEDADGRGGQQARGWRAGDDSEEAGGVVGEAGFGEGDGVAAGAPRGLASIGVAGGRAGADILRELARYRQRAVARRARQWRRFLPGLCPNAKHYGAER